MAYRDVVIGLGPAHLCRFESDVLDSVGAVVLTNGGCTFDAPPVCEDAANGMKSLQTSVNVQITNIVSVTGSSERKAVGGWIRANAIQLPPNSVYREGATGPRFNLNFWAGNNLIF